MARDTSILGDYAPARWLVRMTRLHMLWLRMSTEVRLLDDLYAAWLLASPWMHALCKPCRAYSGRACSHAVSDASQSSWWHSTTGSRSTIVVSLGFYGSLGCLKD